MRNRKYTIFVIKIGLFILFLNIFISNSIFAERKDPFENIDNIIEEFSLEIKNSGNNKGCELKSGYQVVEYYNEKTTGAKAIFQDIVEQTFSKCYRSVVQRIDQEIQNKILTPFPTSGLACEDFINIKWKIDELAEERLHLFYKEFPQKLQKEYCLEDERSFSFYQTSEKWKELKKKIKDIKKKFSDTHPRKNIILQQKQQKEERRKKRNQRIKKQAKERVESFVNEFIERSITSPLYAERSKIISHLKGLPNGKSQFVASKPIDISEMFSIPKDTKNGKKLLLSQTKEKNTSEIMKIIKNNKEKNVYTFSQSIEKKSDIKKKLDILISRFNSDLQQQEKTREFTEAYCNAIINSLKPFHSTLQEAEKFLNEDEKALRTVLNRQNILITGN